MNEGRFHIRVTKDGNKTNFEMTRGDVKLADMTYIEVLELALQATSSLRWIDRPFSK